MRKRNPAGRDRVILEAPKLDDLVFQPITAMYDVMPDGEHFIMVLSPRYLPPTTCSRYSASMLPNRQLF